MGDCSNHFYGRYNKLNNTIYGVRMKVIKYTTVKGPATTVMRTLISHLPPFMKQKLNSSY